MMSYETYQSKEAKVWQDVNETFQPKTPREKAALQWLFWAAELETVEDLIVMANRQTQRSCRRCEP